MWSPAYMDEWDGDSNHTHGKDRWISSWCIHLSLNRPVHKLQWRHKNMHSRPLTDKSMLPPHTSLHMALHQPRGTQEQLKRVLHFVSWDIQCVCNNTHLAVTFSKERTRDHTTCLLHCYQLDNVVAARSGYLYIQEQPQKYSVFTFFITSTGNDAYMMAAIGFSYVSIIQNSLCCLR